MNDSSLTYFLSQFSQSQAEFILSRFPKACPAKIVDPETDSSQPKEENNMLTVMLQLSIDSDVNMPLLKVPVASSRYLRLPLKAGDWGLVVPSDYPIQNAIGASDLMPDIGCPVPNMSAFIFIPFSRLPNPQDEMAWPVADPDTLLLSGEANGVEIRNQYDGKNTLKLTQNNLQIQIGNSTSIFVEEDSISLISGTSKIRLQDGKISLMEDALTIDSKGVHIQNLTADNLQIGGQNFLSHTHISTAPGKPTSSVNLK